MRHVLNVTRIVATGEWRSRASMAAWNAFVKGRAVLIVRRREANHCPLVLNETRLPKSTGHQQRIPTRKRQSYVPCEHIAEVSVVRREGSCLFVGIRFSRARIIHDKPFWFEASEETKRMLILRHMERIKRLGLYPAWAADEIMKAAGNDKMRLAVMFRAVRRVTINNCPFNVAILTIAPLGEAAAFITGRVVYVIRSRELPAPLTLPMLVRMNWDRPFSRRQLRMLNLEHSCTVIAEMSKDERKRLAELVAVTNDLDAVAYRILCALETIPALLSVVNKEAGTLWDDRHWALRYMEQGNVSFGFGMVLDFLRWAQTLAASHERDLRFMAGIGATKLAALSSIGFALDRGNASRVVSLVAIEQLVKTEESHKGAMTLLMTLRKTLLQIAEDAERTNTDEGAVTRMVRRLLSWGGGR